MAIQQIPVFDAPFQGGINGTDITNPTTGIVTTVTSSKISFINDGYTVLVVNVGNTTTNIYIPSIPDNAGRIGNIGVVGNDGVPVAPPIGQNIAADTTRVYGPFRPIWWNFGGVVNVAFSNIDTVTVSALRFQF